jgi:hypothetical protein
MLEIQAALIDWQKMNSDKQWARVVVNSHLVVLEYGVIHSNWMEECPLGSIVYTAKEGHITKVKTTHGG